VTVMVGAPSSSPSSPPVRQAEETTTRLGVAALGNLSTYHRACDVDKLSGLCLLFTSWPYDKLFTSPKVQVTVTEGLRGRRLAPNGGCPGARAAGHEPHLEPGPLGADDRVGRHHARLGGVRQAQCLLGGKKSGTLSRGKLFMSPTNSG
jgi:hypothetical protein